MSVVPTVVDRTRLASLVERERHAYAEAHPASRALFEQAGHLFGRVPMTWMNMWSGGFPLYLEHAGGSRVVDVDGHEYVDLALGDTGAMAGHSPEPTVEAVIRRIRDEGGLTAMLPTADAEWVGAELARRFGLPRWLFTLTATDANRTALRLARLVTGRPKVLVFSYCYHGSVGEAFAVRAPDGRTVARAGNVGPPVDVAATTTAIEFNDVGALEAALATGEVACVLAEPAMTNVGIVLPEPGYHDALRELTRAAGALLIIDETHTFSAGPGGCTAAWGLAPDVLTIGKAIGSGIPSGALGLTAGVAGALLADPDADYEDTGGVGGTLAGNALSTAAMRATLEHVLTEAAFSHTMRRAGGFAAGVEAVIAAHALPWHVTRLGCRVEYGFTAPPPRDG